eukprot:gene6062-biopygen16345
MDNSLRSVPGFRSPTVLCHRSTSYCQHSGASRCVQQQPQHPGAPGACSSTRSTLASPGACSSCRSTLAPPGACSSDSTLASPGTCSSSLSTLAPPGACNSSLSTEVRRDLNPRRSPTVLCHRRTSKLQATVDEVHRNQITDGALPP